MLYMTPDAIEAEHCRLGYTLGWRFLMCPEARLDDADVAIITLNPAGKYRGGAEWSQELGNAYAIESWGKAASGASPLQQQIQRLCILLGRQADTVLAATFVPFRSPRWSSLPNQNEARAFSKELWKWALTRSPAKLFLCVGKNVVGPDLAILLNASKLPSIPTGWGQVTIDRYQATDGRLIVSLPHLSTFKLFSRETYVSAFKNSISGLWPTETP
jgi:hypothetical protein